ncbi:hypothetical protein FisN_5Lh475 [Fistulifera solaris]|uniref:Alcohol dehydrogenase iron-type/glycerol dehydrogenase GldA domain-containing protein n=1 Tax=Fistulifera solaris TaxID=1519565 RepID=A0A1Z5KHE9_FISSO|nr:hypothetical protein FisN_5Lh475 [Fistulifera solaris]|eukprot:GAX25378.1 hypothetical protein FisN_5Lh475 [Fistulifera solaris]
MNILHGRKALQNFLQSQKAHFGAAPILIVESKPLNGVENKQVDEVCRWTRFVLQQQLGFRTVVYHSQHLFPTLSDQQQAFEMASRVGASTVAAVGSGSAMDLGKSMSWAEDRILMPATPTAILAAGSSHSLIYDLAEDTLVPIEQKRGGTIALMHSKTDQVQEALYACLAIAIDNFVQGTSRDSTFADDVLRMIKEKTSKVEDAEDLLIRSGQSLRYGLDENNRSIPLAIVSSLVTNELSSYSAMGVMASLVPSLVNVLPDKYSFDFDKELLDAAPRAITSSSIESLLAHIRDNQGATGCYDISEEKLRKVLQFHTVNS